MTPSKIVSYIAWLVVALPFVLEKFFKVPAVSSAPALSAIASSLGVVVVLISRVVGTIGAEGVKPFFASGTFQAGIIALATVWLGYFNVDYTELSGSVQSIIVGITTIIGMINSARAQKALSIA